MTTGKLFLFKSTCTRGSGVIIRKGNCVEMLLSRRIKKNSYSSIHLHLKTRWRWVISFTFRPLYTRKTVEWALEPFGHYKKLKKLLPLPRIELRFVGLSVLNPVTIPTELAPVYIYIYIYKIVNKVWITSLEFQADANSWGDGNARLPLQLRSSMILHSASPQFCIASRGP